jgi:hypothetical protein
VALIAVTAFKCFLYDLREFGGLYRIGSLLGLAIALAATPPPAGSNQGTVGWVERSCRTKAFNSLTGGEKRICILRSTSALSSKRLGVFHLPLIDAPILGSAGWWVKAGLTPRSALQREHIPDVQADDLGEPEAGPQGEAVDQMVAGSAATRSQTCPPLTLGVHR